MTRVSYNVISNIGNTTLYTGIKSYPQAASTAASVGGQVVTIYTPIEIKDETRAKDRLIARA
jgi:hypothetical protein